MSEAAASHVFKTPEGGWRVADSRVSLDSIVCAFWEGKSPENILEDFPALSLAQVYGALAFYIGNRHEIDAYLSQKEQMWNDLQAQSASQHGPLLRRLRNGRPHDTTD